MPDDHSGEEQRGDRVNSRADTVSSRLEADGFAVLEEVIDDARCDILALHLQAFGTMGVGSRALLMQPWCEALAENLKESPLLRGVLPLNAVAVQCTVFDKSPTKNWLVALHQDLSVPVKRRIENPECTGWSEKEGQVYAQPPVEVLEQLVAVRVHVDRGPIVVHRARFAGSARQPRLIATG